MAITTYSYSPNRLMVVDWASLSYHQIHSVASRKKKSYLDIDTAEEELAVWRNAMLYKMAQYVRLFNPMDIVFTGEGKNLWRNEFVREWYEENAVAYFNRNEYWLKYDNFLMKLWKDDDGSIAHKKMDPVLDLPRVPENCRKVSEFPERVRNFFWNHLPLYKGNRSKNVHWELEVDRKVWRDYKEEYAHNVGKVFRAHVIGIDAAEGDDVAYVVANYWKDKYDEIILITGDSDWNQLMSDKVQIFNHRTEEMVICDDPAHYIGIKVLAGDRGDNVSGIALPGKKTQLGEAGATKLFESHDWHQRSIQEGWNDQYLRNKRLIDLSYIPTHVQRSICDLLDQSKPQTCPHDEFLGMGFNDKIVHEISAMKNLGYFSLLDKDYVKENPDVFNKSLRIAMDQGRQAETTIMSTGRIFGDFDDIFFDPTR